MRKLLYYISLPFIWIFDIIDDWKEYGFRNGVWAAIVDTVENFFYDHHHNGVFGPGGRGWRTFKSGNLALLIAIITLILVIVFII